MRKNYPIQSRHNKIIRQNYWKSSAYDYFDVILQDDFIWFFYFICIYILLFLKKADILLKRKHELSITWDWKRRKYIRRETDD